MNIRIKVEKFEPEPTFEKTINEIKTNYLKNITSIDMNVSAITLDKPSFSSENIISELMPWILLQSLGKSPQPTKYSSSMHHKENNQLQIRKWWVPLRSSLHLYFFWSNLCQ